MDSPLRLYFVSIVHQAVEDGIGEGGVADAVVPFFGRQLTGSECGACAVAVFQDFQQVTALLCVQFDQAPVIEDEGLGFRQGVEELGVASIPFGDAHAPGGVGAGAGTGRCSRAGRRCVPGRRRARFCRRRWGR